MPEDDDWGDPQTSNIHDLEESGPLVGTYTGYKEVDGTYGVSRLHQFENDGRRVSVWGKAHINTLLEGREGELVKVAMTGNEIDLGGGKKMKEYVLWSKGRGPNAPTPPQKPLQAPEGGEGDPFRHSAPEGADEAVRLRARRLAIAAKDAQLDDDMRGDLVEFYTFGETRSSKELTQEQAEKLYMIIQKIRQGRIDIRYDEKGKLYLERSDGKPVSL